ncbi:hypothetical protein BDQ17DRAFT_1175918, partial [Cyathus striatus]
FAAWILDNDLPWTTGESNILSNLFKYLKISYMLPSDTAVHNELAYLQSCTQWSLRSFQYECHYFLNEHSLIIMIYTFVCSIASFIDDNWALVEHIINFWPLESKEHKGI